MPSPRLFLDMAPALAERFPALVPKSIRGRGGRKLALTRQRFLTHLLELDYTRERPHPTHPSANEFKRQALMAELHLDSERGRLASMLRPYFRFPEGTTWSHRTRGQGKPYEATAEVRAAYQVPVSTGNTFPAYLDRRDGSDPVAFGDLPDAGIIGDPRGAPHVPKLFPLRLDRAEAASEHLRERIAGEGESAPFSVSESLPIGTVSRRLDILAHWVRSIGGIPNLGTVTRNGRITPLAPHPLGIPSGLLRLLAGDSGLVRYTLADPHWAVYRSLARSLGIPTPMADDYTEDRVAWLAHWRDVSGVEDTLRLSDVAGTWLLGGNLYAYPSYAGVRLIGREPLQRLSEDIATRALFSETRDGIREVVRGVLRKESDGGAAAYYNALGLPLTADVRRITLGRRCAHALDGYAGWVMRRAAEMAGDVVSISGDALLTPAADGASWPRTIAQQSKEQLGITLHVEFAREEL